MEEEGSADGSKKLWKVDKMSRSSLPVGLSFEAGDPCRYSQTRWLGRRSHTPLLGFCLLVLGLCWTSQRRSWF